ncbi:MAG: integrase [Rickettsiales bacterium]|jgi:integrase
MIDTRNNEQNEVVKYQFFQELESCGINDKDPRDNKTILQYINAIHEFEIATNFKDFVGYDLNSGLEFKEHLEKKISKKTGKNISKSLYVHYLKYTKEFFEWLRKEQKEYSKIKQKDINYLKTNKNDKNTALATGHQESNLVKDLLVVIRNMPASSPIQMRNKAILSLCLITCPRIKALLTARICSIRYFDEYEAWAFDQNPKLVDTKAKKHITSFFVGQSQDIIDNVLNWIKFLKENGFTDHDYLFPRIDSSFDSNGQSICQLSKDVIDSDSWVRSGIFKPAFKASDIQYYRPHSFRHSLARLARKQPDPTNLLIALAENDGHKNVMAVLISSYGGDYMADRSKLMKDFKLE